MQKIDPLLVPEGLNPEILLSQKEIELIISELAEQLEDDFHGKTVHTAFNLQGAVHFYARMMAKIYELNMRRLQKIINVARENGKSDSEIRPLVEAARLIIIDDSIGTSKYGHGTDKSDQVYLTKDLKESVEGQILIVFEDVLDSGDTLKFLRDHFAKKDVAQLVFACLFEKDTANLEALDCTVYIGEHVPDKWLVGGPGLDGIGRDHGGLLHGGMYRCLPYLTTPL